MSFRRRESNGTEREPARIELRLKNDLGEIDRCLGTLDEFCSRFAIPPEIRRAVAVALDELLSNIISYAFRGDGEHLIDVEMAADQEHFRAIVRDDGVPFDPFTRPPADTTGEIESRPIGGLGIHLVQTLMDDVSHRRVDGKNVNTLMKRLGK